MLTKEDAKKGTLQQDEPASENENEPNHQDEVDNRQTLSLGRRIELVDTDGDGLSDEEEDDIGTDPLNPDNALQISFLVVKTHLVYREVMHMLIVLVALLMVIHP